MDENVNLTAEETEMVSKALAKFGMNAYRRGFIAGAGAAVIGVVLGIVGEAVSEAIKNRKKKTDKQ